MPPGSPSSLAADCPPASSAQQTWLRPDAARAAPTPGPAPARVGDRPTRAMKRLFDLDLVPDRGLQGIGHQARKTAQPGRAGCHGSVILAVCLPPP